MARVYDARKLYVAARDAYLELAARYPKVRLEPGGPDGRRGAWPGSWRASRTSAWSPTGTSRPSRRRCSADGTGRPRRDRAVRALSTEGVVPSLEASRIVLGYRDRLRLLDASDGVSRWSAELGSPAEWAGYLEDKLIAAGPGQVVALDLATGTVQWRYRPGGTGKDANRPDPFAARRRGVR